MCRYSNNDFFLSSTGGAQLLAYHWGDIATANQIIDKQIPNILRATREPDQSTEAFGSVVVFGGGMPLLTDLLGRGCDMHTLMCKAGYTWTGTAERAAKLPVVQPMIRP
eukprot:SAG11_NODE_990_length_6270_cov_38.630044_7_plen_109_part_00